MRGRDSGTREPSLACRTLPEAPAWRAPPEWQELRWLVWGGGR